MAPSQVLSGLEHRSCFMFSYQPRYLSYLCMDLSFPLFHYFLRHVLSGNLFIFLISQLQQLALSLFLSFFLSESLSLSCTQTLSHSSSFSSLSLSLSLSFSLTHTLTHSHSFSHVHTLSHTHPLLWAIFSLSLLVKLVSTKQGTNWKCFLSSFEINFQNIFRDISLD